MNNRNALGQGWSQATRYKCDFPFIYELRMCYKSLSRGRSTWSDYCYHSVSTNGQTVCLSLGGPNYFFTIATKNFVPRFLVIASALSVWAKLRLGFQRCVQSFRQIYQFVCVSMLDVV
jgi:hypothetical protein